MKDRELWKVEEVRRSLWLKENSLDIQTTSTRMGKILSGGDGGRTYPAGNNED